MKENMKGINFENELPAGYRQILHLNANDLKIGLIFNLIAVVIAAVVMAIAFGIAQLFGGARVSISLDYIVALLLFCAAIIAYIILHELTHGIVYKKMTGEKLTFGLSWSCAFCGVPNIFTYRNTTKHAVAAPLLVFSMILIPLTALLFFVHPTLYYFSALLFAIHLGGCSGDIYVLILLAKYKDAGLLVRDTGPEQFFYLPDETKPTSSDI